MDLDSARRVVGVDADTPWSEVRLRYKKLALRHHPDKNPGDVTAADTFARLKTAYDVLERAALAAESQQRQEYKAREQSVSREFYDERMRERASVAQKQREAEKAAQEALWDIRRRQARLNVPCPRPYVVASDEASVTVAWKAPDGALFGPTACFELEHCLVRAPPGPATAYAFAWVSASASLTQTQARKKNLRPGHAYVFRVRAKNEHGEWGLWSEPTAAVEPTLPEENALQPGTCTPAHTRVSLPAGAGQLVVDRPEMSKHFGASEAWELEYRVLRGLWTRTGPEGSPPLTAPQHLLEGLHDRAQYVVRARAWHPASKVWSRWSPESTPFAVRPYADSKPPSTGARRAVSKALLAAGLRSSRKAGAHGDGGTKAFSGGASYTGEIYRGLAHGHGRLALPEEGGVVEGAFELDLPHGHATMDEGAGTFYDGQWALGARHGKGTQLWATGAFVRYEGAWREGKFEGSGTLAMRSGETYEGEWRAGVRHGHGAASSPETGNAYKGGWQEGRYAGKGVGRFTFPDKSVYEGEVLDGVRHGQGSLTSGQADPNAIGWHYKGHFSKGDAHGAGELELADGRAYRGQFVQGRKEGKGRFSWPNGDFLEGAWEQGEQKGDAKVRITYHNGDVYTGGFIRGMQHGEGSYVRQSGYTYTGQWHVGMRQGTGKWRAPNGDWYEGHWEGDVHNGKGKTRRSFPSGVYTGATLDGQITGRGVFEWTDGRKYDGEWSHDSPQGHGTFVDADGDRYTGQFVAGRYQGQGKLTRADGDYFHGEFSGGERVGRGKARITYNSGDVYEGEVVTGVRNGHGTYTWRGSGERYTGEWEGDEMHGKGKLKAADGRTLRQGVWSHGAFLSAA